MACLLQACSHYEPWSTRALILHEGKRQRKEAALLRKRIPIMIPGDLMCTSAQVCTPMHALSCVRGHTHTHTYTHKRTRAQTLTRTTAHFPHTCTQARTIPHSDAPGLDANADPRWDVWQNLNHQVKHLEVKLEA